MGNWNKLSPTYKSYRQAQRRCNDPKAVGYKNYGGRGIKFKFTNWKEIAVEIGERPEGMTLDRINTNGHYEPGNIRWATREQQERNKRRFKMTPEMVEMVKKLKSAGFSYRDIYFKTGINSARSVGLALKGYFDGE